MAASKKKSRKKAVKRVSAAEEQRKSAFPKSIKQSVLYFDEELSKIADAVEALSNRVQKTDDWLLVMSDERSEHNRAMTNIKAGTMALREHVEDEIKDVNQNSISILERTVDRDVHEIDLANIRHTMGLGVLAGLSGFIMGIISIIIAIN